jgi:hypothetical protein
MIVKNNVKIHAKSIRETWLRVLRNEDEDFSWMRDDVELFQKNLL